MDDLDIKLSATSTKLSQNLSSNLLKNIGSPELPRLPKKMLNEEIKTKSESSLRMILSQNDFKSPSLSPSLSPMNFSTKNHRYRRSNFDEEILKKTSPLESLPPNFNKRNSEYLIRNAEIPSYPISSLKKSQLYGIQKSSTPQLKPDITLMNLRISPSILQAKVLNFICIVINI